MARDAVALARGAAPPAVRRAAAPLLAAGLLLAAACGEPPASDAGSPPDGSASLRPLPTPAAGGSGEPNLAVGPDGAVHLSWLEPSADGPGHLLRFSVLEPGDGGGWSEPRTVARGDDFFVNWADFPSLLPLSDGTLAAHWLQRNGEGTYAYGVRVATSRDGGATWSEPVIPHDDGTPTEHGFVSLFPDPAGGLGMAWLDGRDFAAGDGGRAKSPLEAQMSLRYARLEAGAGAGAPGRSAGAVRDRSLVDGRVCDCCQTSVALTDGGALLVYRDRSPDEIRDVHAARLGPGGWSEPRPVHRDGWEIEACPVNGPSVDARGSRAAVAWFTAAGDTSRVRAAFSSDGGASFDSPVRLDGGRPVGRVDVVLAPDGSAVVSWLEAGDEGARLLLRRVAPGGTAGPPLAVADASASRSAGFPRMALSGDRIVVTWTDPDPGGVRAGWLSLEDVPLP